MPNIAKFHLFEGNLAHLGGNVRLGVQQGHLQNVSSALQSGGTLTKLTPSVQYSVGGTVLDAHLVTGVDALKDVHLVNLEGLTHGLGVNPNTEGTFDAE